MKAFFASVAAMVVIAVVVAFVLGALDFSAQNVYQMDTSVRL